MKKTKTNRVAYISCCRHRIERRIWTDGTGNEFVKVNGDWVDLWKTYGSNRTYTVTVLYQPVGE